MKQNLFLLLCLLLVAGFFLWRHTFVKEETPTAPTKNAAKLSPAVTMVGKAKKMLFVPYWSMNDKPIDSSFDKYVYFGVTADENGINTQDPGYKNIKQFVKDIPQEKEKYLAVRLINQDFNTKLLEEKSLQEKIATTAAKIATENGFKGLVLDLELSALSFDSVINSITEFNKEFSDVSKVNGLTFFTTIFGDTFYRARPYDVTKIAKTADGVFVMAYDFSKAKGDPGPNFPLSGKDTYGYDYTMLVSDFSKSVPLQKITVVFGLFGYDWTVDEKGRTQGTAESKSTVQMQQKFENCVVKNCLVVRDASAAGTKVTYTDPLNQNHVVWFDDMDWVLKKEEFLKKKGINSFGFWAYSYFQ